MKSDLGVEVADDASGCLQDIHWAMGAIAYFPTYTLGNLCAAQLWESIRGAVGDLDQRLSRGEFVPVLDWLREKVHAHGRRYRAEELLRRVTGDELSHEPLIRHLRAKYAEIYHLS
jgi:carboxypeptidase Taq